MFLCDKVKHSVPQLVVLAENTLYYFNTILACANMLFVMRLISFPNQVYRKISGFDKKVGKLSVAKPARQFGHDMQI